MTPSPARRKAKTGRDWLYVIEWAAPPQLAALIPRDSCLVKVGISGTTSLLDRFGTFCNAWSKLYEDDGGRKATSVAGRLPTFTRFKASVNAAQRESKVNQVIIETHDTMHADPRRFPGLISLSFCGEDSASSERSIRAALDSDAKASRAVGSSLSTLIRRLKMESGSVGPTECIVAKRTTVAKLRASYLDRVKLLHCYRPAEMGGTDETKDKPWTFLYPPHLRLSTVLAICGGTES